MKPNIFRISTKELSQDGFITWLLQWADSRYSQKDQQLNEAAKDFVRLLLGKKSDFQIHKVEAGTQWHNIDIWAEINDEYFIGIEDKIDSAEHSKQLERYKNIAIDHYKDKAHSLFFVYLKTGNESLSTLKQVTEKGYSIIGRKEFLNVLNKHSVGNDIYNDFKEHLSGIEIQTNSYTQFANVTTNWKAAEGFYLKLQDLITEWTEWQPVPTPSGHFLGFWYHWTETEEIGEIYIQIRNGFENGIQLVIKIGSWKPNAETLYKLLEEIKPFATSNNLAIEKPSRFKAGTTSTLAIIQNAFLVNSDGSLDLDHFIKTLKQLEKTLDEYCMFKKLIKNSSN
jgi:PD-(D/E)XK nuclease superfamily